MSERSASYASTGRPVSRRGDAVRSPARPGARGTSRGSSRAAADRRRAEGRRRLRRWVLALALLIVAAVIVTPTVTRVYRKEFGLPLKYADVIRERASVENLDPAFVAAVIDAETKFDPRPSAAGALGLMQILPQTAEFLAHRSKAQTFTIADLATPRVNITYGCYYLRYLLDEYHGSEALAAAAYNGGETNVNKWLASARADGRRFRVADIPFAETHDYVVKVMGLIDRYRTTYGSQLGLS